MKNPKSYFFYLVILLGRYLFTAIVSLSFGLTFLGCGEQWRHEGATGNDTPLEESVAYPFAQTGEFPPVPTGLKDIGSYEFGSIDSTPSASATNLTVGLVETGGQSVARRSVVFLA